jgi:hypothetical protein
MFGYIILVLCCISLVSGCVIWGIVNYIIAIAFTIATLSLLQSRSIFTIVPIVWGFGICKNAYVYSAIIGLLILVCIFAIENEIKTEKLK